MTLDDSPEQATTIMSVDDIRRALTRMSHEIVERNQGVAGLVLVGIRGQQAAIGGHDVEWNAVITEQIPEERVAWRSTDGTPNAGVVTFHRLSDESSRVMVQIEHEPEGLVEKAGSALGFDDRRVKGDLQRFKDLVEARGAPTGGWRGEVENPDDRAGGTTPSPGW